MCFSSNFIEQRAYEISKEIRKNSIYKFVKAELSDGNCLELQEQSDGWNESTLITKVILEDTTGTLYSIEPNSNGLRFAQGEITYKQYRKLQKREVSNAITWFIIIISLFIVVGWSMQKYVIPNL